MLAKCWQNVKMSKILKNSIVWDILANTNARFTCWTNVGWRTTNGPTFIKVKKNWLQANFQNTFGDLQIFIVLLMYFSDLNIEVLPIFRKCSFIATSPFSKWYHFWPVACHFYNLLATCWWLVACLVLYQSITPCCKIQL